MDAILSGAGSWLGLLGSAGLLLVGHVVKNYVIPFLKIGRHQKYAEFIAMIADEVIDELRGKYPEKEWLKHLDEAVEQLTAICDIAPDVATRAVNASATRK